MNIALGFFEVLMKLLHPFMPFISEEIWQYIAKRPKEEALCISEWPMYDSSSDSKIDVHQFDTIKSIVSAIRNIRAENQISPKTEITVYIKTVSDEVSQYLNKNSWILYHIQALNYLKISTTIQKPKASASALIGSNEIYVPLAGIIDIEKEVDRINKEIQRLEVFLKGVNSKLNNTNFRNNAPESIVQNELNKKRDGEANLFKTKGTTQGFRVIKIHENLFTAIRRTKKT